MTYYTCMERRPTTVDTPTFLMLKSSAGRRNMMSKVQSTILQGAEGNTKPNVRRGVPALGTDEVGRVTGASRTAMCPADDDRKSRNVI